MQIQLGGQIVVTATERWLSEIRAGRAFSAGKSLGSGAGVYAHAELWNPAGSGKQVLVRGIYAASSVNNVVDLRIHNAAMTTDDGAGLNLLSGGADAQAHLTHQTNAALLGTEVFLISRPAFDAIYLGTEWMAELSPGYGLIAASLAANVDINVTYLWAEV